MNGVFGEDNPPLLRTAPQATKVTLLTIKLPMDEESKGSFVLDNVFKDRDFFDQPHANHTSGK